MGHSHSLFLTSTQTWNTSSRGVHKHMSLCMCYISRSMSSMITCSPYNVGFPRSCQAAQHTALQIKADSHSVPLSLTHCMCPHLINLPRVPLARSTHVRTHTELPQSVSSLCSLCSSHLLRATKQEKRVQGSQDDCITVSPPHCCICHMDARDYL